MGTATSTIAYGYTDQQWGDLLTSYNGQTFAYDEIGNLTNDGTWAYTWKQGRQLAQMTQGATTWTYTYDDKGLRTQRTNGTETYNYIYSGGLLRAMMVDGHSFIFRYGADGRPYSVQYDGEDYFYVLNAQGDVLAIVDGNGANAAVYTYNAWGNVMSSFSSTLAQLNPLRYRGYVYDQETGLYYLQSRYYNPEWGRFINADDPAYLGADGTPVSYNLFAYCGNNPVWYSDPTGTFINTITGALVGAIIGAVNAAIKGDDVLAGAAIGAATGALAGAAADIAIATGGIGGIAIAAVGGAMASGANYTATEIANGREIDGGTLALEMTVGAAANLLTFGVGGGSLTSRGGKLLSNMTNDFTGTLMKGTTKTVAGKTVSRAAPIVRKIAANNFLTSTAETAVIGVGAWLNSNAWGMLV